jgi:hypothetical protein
MLTKPIDLLMLNRLKESYCGIKVTFFFYNFSVYCHALATLPISSILLAHKCASSYNRNQMTSDYCSHLMLVIDFIHEQTLFYMVFVMLMNI